MQCPRCGLHNMPGSATCFQCQADLAAPAAPTARDFYPVRAEKRGIAEGLKRAAPPRPPSAFSRLPPPLQAAWEDYGQDLRKLLASLLPGRGQRLNGEDAKGLGFSWAAAALLALSVAFLKSGLSTLLLVLLAGLVVWSMTDAGIVSLSRRTGRPIGEQPQAALGMVLLSVSVLLSAYVLVVVASRPFFLRIEVPGNMAGFSRGDVLLVRLGGAGFAPGRGDLVLAQRGRGFVDLDWAPTTEIGDSIEVVLALPGEKVSWEDGALRVGGRPVDPALVAAAPVKGVDLVVPEDSYFDVRHRFVRIGRTAGEETRLATTPRSLLRGRLVAVVYPPRSRRFLRSLP